MVAKGARASWITPTPRPDSPGNPKSNQYRTVYAPEFNDTSMADVEVCHGGGGPYRHRYDTGPTRLAFCGQYAWTEIVT